MASTKKIDAYMYHLQLVESATAENSPNDPPSSGVVKEIQVMASDFDGAVKSAEKAYPGKEIHSLTRHYGPAVTVVVSGDVKIETL